MRLACLAETGLTETGFAAYDRHRLALGVPDGTRDLVPEKSILLELGFDELNGVDWRKGCYVGQELTARTKYRGLIKKRLFPVRIDGPAPEPGTMVTLDGKDAGEMRSARDGAGLALLRLEAARRNRRSLRRECAPRAVPPALDAHSGLGKPLIGAFVSPQAALPRQPAFSGAQPSGAEFDPGNGYRASQVQP